jgi:hypothetical protein
MCEDSSFLEQTKSLYTKKSPSKKEELSENCCSKLGFYYLIVVDQNFTSVVKFTFMPVGTVVQMGFTCSATSTNLRGRCLEVCSSFVPSGFRYFSFRMRHFSRF